MLRWIFRCLLLLLCTYFHVTLDTSSLLSLHILSCYVGYVFLYFFAHTFMLRWIRLLYFVFTHHVTLDRSSLLLCTYFHVTLDTSSLLRLHILSCYVGYVFSTLFSHIMLRWICLLYFVAHTFMLRWIRLLYFVLHILSCYVGYVFFTSVAHTFMLRWILCLTFYFFFCTYFHVTLVGLLYFVFTHHVTLDTSSLLRCTYFHVTLDTSSLLRCTYFHVTLDTSSLLRCHTSCYVGYVFSTLFSHIMLCLRWLGWIVVGYFVFTHHVTLDMSSLLWLSHIMATLRYVHTFMLRWIRLLYGNVTLHTSSLFFAHTFTALFSHIMLRWKRSRRWHERKQLRPLRFDLAHAIMMIDKISQIGIVIPSGSHKKWLFYYSGS